MEGGREGRREGGVMSTGLGRLNQSGHGGGARNGINKMRASLRPSMTPRNERRQIDIKNQTDLSEVGRGLSDIYELCLNPLLGVVDGHGLDGGGAMLMGAVYCTPFPSSADSV